MRRVASVTDTYAVRWDGMNGRGQYRAMYDFIYNGYTVQAGGHLHLFQAVAISAVK